MSTVDDAASRPLRLAPHFRTTNGKRPNAWLYFVLAAGVAGPLIAVVAEIAFGMCSFVCNPIPTWWHLALLCAVPAGNLVAIWAYFRGDPRGRTAAALLIGLAVGVSFFYSLQFLPIASFSLLAVIFFGLGLPGLTPFFALAASIVAARRLAAADPERAVPRLPFRAGVAAAVLVLVLHTFSQAITLVGMRMAVSGDDAARLRGVRIIRTMGSESAVLRACYGLPIDIWLGLLSINSGEDRVTTQDAREVYYRVTGKPFNSVPPPRRLGPRTTLVSDFEFDSDVGGTAVNGVSRGVSLRSSRMDTVVEPDALVAYTEWTMVFGNSSNTQREARAEIALPPGGVVSRLTLWVDGEEREAAFSTRGKVRAAYQQVAVVERRDPVLVTTCGPDRVLMQCFPIPPDGGTMKVRMGITAPLEIESLDTGRLALPRFVERNFRIPDNVTHSLFAESGRDLKLAGHSGGAGRSAAARVPDAELAARRLELACSRDPDNAAVWVPDILAPDDHAIVQTVERASSPPPAEVAIVVDGSRSLAGLREQIADALHSLPVGCRFQVIHAGDEVRVLVPPVEASADTLRSAADAVVRARFVGGVDSTPALVRAWESVGSSGRGVIVWVHGPQPFASGSGTEQLVQLAERRPGAVKLMAVAAADGRNNVLAELERTGAAESVPRRGDLAADLSRLFAGWSDNPPATYAARRARVPIAEATGVRCSPHVARLWARDEVARMCETLDSGRKREASVLAARHQLVTSVSGAVVLETAEQYQRAGLEPVDPASVPEIVPEPSGLIAVAAGAALLAAGGLRRRACRRVPS